MDIICKKLNDFNTNDQQRKPTTRTGFVERETDLTSDNNNNNEQRLIQRDFDEEFETPWDEENDAVPQEVGFKIYRIHSKTIELHESTAALN